MREAARGGVDLRHRRGNVCTLTLVLLALLLYHQPTPSMRAP